MDIARFYEILLKENNIKVIKKFLQYEMLNTDLCSIKLGEGSFGVLHANNIPSRIDIIGENTMVFKNIVYKKGLKRDADNIKFYTKNNKLYVVSYNLYGEAFVSMLVSNLFIRDVSPHFPVSFGFSRCDDKILILFENLMNELENGDMATTFYDISAYLKDRNIRITEELIDHLIISLLHSVFVLNYNFKMIHFDIYERNIFIKEFKENEQYFMGKDMTQIKYFAYQLPDGKIIYTKNFGFIIKIGDFGLATMNIGKIIISNNTKYDNFLALIHHFYPSYPNNIKHFLPEYYLFLRSFIRTFGLSTSKILLELLTSTPILNDHLEYDIDFLSASMNSDKKNVPKINLDNVIEPNIILSSNLFDKYRVKPDDSTKDNTVFIKYALPDNI